MLKTYDLILDEKNKRVLVKKLYNKPMTKQERKRLVRTIRVIETAKKNVEFNQQHGNNIFM